tara:strand:+ start:13961 stop:14230 length:270 start_codon:yes stop_codon:yes gene_type:complete
MKNNVTLLDCTLRDGGYYNNWDFSENLINKYLSPINKAGIDEYETNDYKQIELQQTFESLGKKKNFIPYYSITNTKLNIPTISLHTLLD